MNRAFAAKGPWLVQLVSIVALTIWAASDAAFEVMIQRLRIATGTPFEVIQEIMRHVGYWRPLLLLCVVVVSLGGLGCWLAKLFIRQRPSPNVYQGSEKTLRMLLGMTAIIACWCGFAIHYSTIGMQGKRIRLAARVADFESLAAPLRNDWPDRDGEITRIGPFMAYPYGKPTTLLLITPPTVSGGATSISTVEKSTDGVIRLMLGSQASDLNARDWAEWHPDGSRPDSFTDGLRERHFLRSSCSLGAGWYLVRYDT